MVNFGYRRPFILCSCKTHFKLPRFTVNHKLILSVLPDIAREEVFALKGGTAINLFYRDMPRLSVDIDLTYLPVGDREISLKDIDETLDRIMAAITDRATHVCGRDALRAAITMTRGSC